MKVKAQLNGLRLSPPKVRLVADLVRGKSLSQALSILDGTVKKAARPLAKLIASAAANAEHNFGLDKNNLYIYNVTVGEGLTMKRWLPRAHGRATKLLKRTSKVSLVLAEIEPGKNRVTPPAKEAARRSVEEKKPKVSSKEPSSKQAIAPGKKEVVAGEKNKLDNKPKIFRRKSG